MSSIDLGVVSGAVVPKSVMVSLARFLEIHPHEFLYAELSLEPTPDAKGGKFQQLVSIEEDSLPPNLKAEIRQAQPRLVKLLEGAFPWQEVEVLPCFDVAYDIDDFTAAVLVAKEIGECPTGARIWSYQEPPAGEVMDVFGLSNRQVFLVADCNNPTAMEYLNSARRLALAN